MVMKKKAEILIIDDFSTDSNLAVEAGISWAKKFNCTPSLINFERSDVVFNLDINIPVSKTEEYLVEIREKERILIAKKRPLFFKTDESEPLFDFTDDIHNIIEQAKKRNSKLIVLAYGAENRSNDFFTSSTIEKFIRLSHIPVLIVKNYSITNFQKILLPFSLDQVTFDTLDYAEMISKFTDNTVVTPIHIVEEEIFCSLERNDFKRYCQRNLIRDKDEILKKLEKRLYALAADGNFTETSLINQKSLPLGKALINSINLSGSDLVIVGKREGSGIFDFLQKSEIEEFLDEISQSILVVKPFNPKH